MASRLLVSVLLVVGCAVAPACSSSSSNDSGDGHLDDGLPATCNPLRTPGACATPFPSGVYLDEDATSPTGVRVHLAAEAMPTSGLTNAPFDTSRYDVADGFSAATPLVAYFSERIDPASLVPVENAATVSVTRESPTFVVDMTTNTLVAHLSEVDQSVVHDDDRQAVILRPLARLAGGHRYAVAITNRARTIDGKTPSAPPLFHALAEGRGPTDAMSRKQAARLPDVLASIKAAAGVEEKDLLLAWDFVTASDGYATAHVISMRDRALAEAASLGYKVTSVENDFDAKVLRRVRGTFTVPQFISQTDTKNPDASLSFDAGGQIVEHGTYEAPFTVIVPRSAATATSPLPLVVFGHGLFGTGENELGDASGSYLQDVADAKGWVLVATDWIGLSANEDPLHADSNSAAGEVLSDFNRLPWITDRLQQALVNAMVLARTARDKIAEDPALTSTGAAGGTPLVDPTELRYYGISLGGIMGGAFMGYDPDVTRGVLNVAGGDWSILMSRSSNWRLFKLLMASSYPDPLDQQVMLALVQMQFDFSDPISVAAHWLKDPLPGAPAKQVLVQMVYGDMQVPNLATAVTARTAQLPLLSDAAVPVPGLVSTPGPLPSALTTWDIHATPLPPTTNAIPTVDNGAHTALRAVPQVEDQIDHFLRAGEVISTCNGTCSLPPVTSSSSTGGP